MKTLMLIAMWFGLGCMPVGQQGKDQLKVWVEQDGMVIIEAENYQPASQKAKVPFKKAYAPAGFSGKGYLVWEGTGHWQDKVPYVSLPGGRSVRYYFEIKNRGTYLAKIRNYHYQEDGDNDIYLSINQSTWNKVYDHQAQEWTWDENGKWQDSYPQYLNPGIYRLEIAGRSVGFGIDKIALFEEKFYPRANGTHLAQPWFSKKESRTKVHRIPKD